MTEQLLIAVSYLHDVVDVAHCDMKLENIVVGVDTTDKPLYTLVDFGLATVVTNGKCISAGLGAELSASSFPLPYT